MLAIFLHGLDSSSKGTKARWFSERFPFMLIPDFTGSFSVRMAKLNTLLSGKQDIVLIGSSFGGLMATAYVQENESNVRQVILLAPALNFSEFRDCRDQRVHVPASLYIGHRDMVCPPQVVIPLARDIFAHISVQLTDDDHLLSNTFGQIDWASILSTDT